MPPIFQGYPIKAFSEELSFQGCPIKAFSEEFFRLSKIISENSFSEEPIHLCVQVNSIVQIQFSEWLNCTISVHFLSLHSNEPLEAGSFVLSIYSVFLFSKTTLHFWKQLARSPISLIKNSVHQPIASSLWMFGTNHSLIILFEPLRTQICERRDKNSKIVYFRRSVINIISLFSIICTCLKSSDTKVFRT